MSFLTVMAAVAKNAGINAPTSASLNNADQIKLAEFINEAGVEIVRRVDWAALRKSTVIIGQGTPTPYDIADDFSRLTIGLSVSANGMPVRGSLTADEWFSLLPVEGQPRYFFLQAGRIAFYPYPPIGVSMPLQYQSFNWVNEGAKDRFSEDGDVAMIPETLLELGGIWRWRRHVGKDYADHAAEFEAALADEAKFDGGVRAP